MVTSVRLGAERETRLRALAGATDRSVNYFIKLALDRTLEDLEDIYIAERRLEIGEEVSLFEDVEKRLGLDD